MKRILNLQPWEKVPPILVVILFMVAIGYALPPYWSLTVDVLGVLAVVLVGVQQAFGWPIVRLLGLVAFMAAAASGVVLGDVASRHGWSGERWILSTIIVTAVLSVLAMVTIGVVLRFFSEGMTAAESD